MPGHQTSIALFAEVVNILGGVDDVRNPAAQAGKAGDTKTQHVGVVSAVKLGACDTAVIAVRAFHRRRAGA